MILSDYKNYDELPLFLNAELIAKTLGIAPSSAYELMREKDFPALHHCVSELLIRIQFGFSHFSLKRAAYACAYGLCAPFC